MAIVFPRGDWYPLGNLPPHYPRPVEIPCGVTAKAIHLLGGVAGWGYPLGERGSVSMIVRIHVADATLRRWCVHRWISPIRSVHYLISHNTRDYAGRFTELLRV